MRRPAWSLEEAIEVRWPREEYEWFALHPSLCGGAWQLERQSLLQEEETEAGSRMTDRLEARCGTCRREAALFFVVQYEGPL